jgi:hypothetical protein
MTLPILSESQWNGRDDGVDGLFNGRRLSLAWAKLLVRTYAKVPRYCPRLSPMRLSCFAHLQTTTLSLSESLCQRCTPPSTPSDRFNGIYWDFYNGSLPVPMTESDPVLSHCTNYSTIMARDGEAAGFTHQRTRADHLQR